MNSFNNLENKTPSDTYLRILIVHKKAHLRNSLEPPLEYHQYQMPLTKQGSL